MRLGTPAVHALRLLCQTDTDDQQAQVAPWTRCVLRADGHWHGAAPPPRRAEWKQPSPVPVLHRALTRSAGDQGPSARSASPGHLASSPGLQPARRPDAAGRPHPLCRARPPHCSGAAVQPAVGDDRVGRHDLTRTERGTELVEDFGGRDRLHGRPTLTRAAIHLLTSDSSHPTARRPSCTGLGKAPSFMYW